MGALLPPPALPTLEPEGCCGIMYLTHGKFMSR